MDLEQGPRGGEPNGLQVVEGSDGQQCHSQASGDTQAKKEVRSTKDEGLIPKAATEKVVKTGAKEGAEVLQQRKGPLLGEKLVFEKRGDTDGRK